MNLHKYFLLLIMAVVAGCGCALAAEKSYRIDFVDVAPEDGSPSASIIGVKVNNNLRTYLGSSYVYVEKFNSIGNTFRDKNGIGWIVGRTDNNNSSNAGSINMALSEAGKVNATSIHVNITAINSGSSNCTC